MAGSLRSVIIPLRDEAESLPQLHAELAAMADADGSAWEFLLVDDGSRDGTWPALVALRARDQRVRAIRLRRNFGQTAAMACGIAAARGAIIATMDGDLQNDPADIPRLLATLEEGYDVVCGWRHRRQDDLWTRKVPSVVANRLIGALTGIRLHDYGCSLKVYRAAAIKRTPLYAGFHRFIPALAALTGAQVAEIRVNHRARRFGRTKYNLWRAWRVALDMVTISLLVKFALKPLRFFGALALLALALAGAGLARLWFWHAGPVHLASQVLPGVVLLSLWLGGHLAIVGCLAELLLATAHERPERLVAIEGA